MFSKQSTHVSTCDIQNLHMNQLFTSLSLLEHSKIIFVDIFYPSNQWLNPKALRSWPIRDLGSLCCCTFGPRFGVHHQCNFHLSTNHFSRKVSPPFFTLKYFDCRWWAKWVVSASSLDFDSYVYGGFSPPHYILLPSSSSFIHSNLI